MTAPLLEIDDLRVSLATPNGEREVLRGLTLGVHPGEAVAVVGESGSGKSMTARAVARLLPDGANVTGAIRFDGAPVLDLSGAALRTFRADHVGMIFQDPRSHINPVLKLEDFLTEPLVKIRGMRRKDARARVIALLDEVGVSRPEARLHQYPHQLSGGLLQRMMIASVLTMEPSLVLADEPTTALDVTTQSDVMSILDDARRERGTSLILITHDLELAAAVCDRTVVMYAGSIMEDQPSSTLHRSPLHPYTAALLASRPSLEPTAELLEVIPGRPLSAIEAPAGCPFASRCRYAEPQCTQTALNTRPLDQGRTSCIRMPELRNAITEREAG